MRYTIIELSNIYNEHFSFRKILYRLDINAELTINDYYQIINDIINMLEYDKDKKNMLRLSITDESNPRMNVSSQLKEIQTFVPYDLFNIIENISEGINEDDDDFHFSNDTIIKVDIIYITD